MKKEVTQKLVFNGATFKKRADFKNLIFKEDANFSNARFEDEVDFTDSEFQKNVFFKKATFKKIADFKNLIFTQDADFYDTRFENHAYFDNSKFEQNADFTQSTFVKKTSFYNVEFKEIPIFFNVTFEERLNLINSSLSSPNYKFSEVLSKIEDKDRSENYRKKANDYRDMYRSFKSALVKGDNLLDAQEYHRLELYCKEIELDSKNPKIFSKDWIDKWQLWFYRIASEHHTDLLKIVNNVILLMALFGMFVFGLMGVRDSDSVQTSLVDILSSLCAEQKVSYFIFKDLNKEYPLEFFWGSYAVFTLLYGISQLFKYFYCEKNKKTWRASWILIGFLFVLLGGIASYFLMEKFQSFREMFVISLVCLAFVLMYLGLMLNRNIILTIYSCFVCVVILIIKPALLFPLFGKMIDESLKMDYPAINSLGVVYCILMLLLLFSLQKTARKNSIIPT